MQKICSSNSRRRRLIKQKNIFKFNFIINSINHKKKLIEFYCPVCNKIEKALFIYDYVSYHEAYEGLDFFCNNCISKYETISEGRIKLISKTLLI